MDEPPSAAKDYTVLLMFFFGVILFLFDLQFQPCRSCHQDHSWLSTAPSAMPAGLGSGRFSPEPSASIVVSHGICPSHMGCTGASRP